MRDGEWQISHAGGSAVFGLADQPVMLAGFPELGDPELEVDDAGRPRMDGRAFGTDYRGGRTITFDLRVSADTETAARAATSELARLWRADVVRGTPGAFAELRTQQNGSERVTYGRPRRWSVNDTLARLGVIGVLCDFATTDDLWYAGEGSSLVVGIAPAPGGGLTSPLVTPLTTTASADRSIRMAVGGEVDTWPIIEITGPVTNPAVGIIGLWEIGLNLSLTAGQTARIDARPWARSVTRDGANIAGALTRSSIRLSKAAIPPGDHELYFRGIDATGTADLAITWRNSFTTL